SGWGQSLAVRGGVGFSGWIAAALASQSGPTQSSGNARTGQKQTLTGTMRFSLELRKVFAVLCVVGFSFPALAQSGGNGKPPEPQKPPADAAKESQKKIDEIAEASRSLTGPAGNPECVWLGRRGVSLLGGDHLGTA